MDDRSQTAVHERRRQPAQAGFFAGPRDVVMPRLVFVGCVAALTLLGLVMVFSSSTVEALNEGASTSSYLIKQAAICVVSVGVCVFIARCIPYYKWRGRLLYGYGVFCLLLLLLTAAIGSVGLGAQRWLTIGPVSFQPSEFAKVAFVLFAAQIFDRYRNGDLDQLSLALYLLFVIVLPLGLLYVTQSDLGTTGICLVGIISVAAFSGMPWKPIVALVVLIVAFAVGSVILTPYRTSRMAFLDPYADPYGTGYQLIRSFDAIGEGGPFGVGLGNSVEKSGFLPEAETDFIFAVICNELGMVGGLVVIVLFMAVCYSGLQIARNAPDRMGAMIAGGCTVMLVFQAFLNIGCVLGVFPTTGKPLPFISNGGSSLLGSFLLVGVILSVSLASGDESGLYQRRRDDLRVVRAEGASRGRAAGADRLAGGRRSVEPSSTRPVRDRTRTGALGRPNARDSHARAPRPARGSEERSRLR